MAPAQTVSVTQTVVERFLASWQSGAEFSWLLFSRAGDELVGAISARLDGHRIDLGHVLARSHWTQGLMTEALLPVVQWAFTEPSVFRVWAVCDTENPGSGRVLEKAGLQREGILRQWARHSNIPLLLVTATPMPRPATPNYALQRTAPGVTVTAADLPRSTTERRREKGEASRRASRRVREGTADCIHPSRVNTRNSSEVRVVFNVSAERFVERLKYERRDRLKTERIQSTLPPSFSREVHLLTFSSRNMLQLVYVSSATIPFSKADLLALLAQSRSNNLRNRLTGLLLFKDGNFIQALEGEEKDVRKTLEKIRLDPRHTGLITLLESNLAEPEFPDWSMAFHDLRDVDLAAYPGYSEFMNVSLTDAVLTKDVSNARRLLSLFRASMR